MRGTLESNSRTRICFVFFLVFPLLKSGIEVEPGKPYVLSNDERGRLHVTQVRQFRKCFTLLFTYEYVFVCFCRKMCSGFLLRSICVYKLASHDVEIFWFQKWDFSFLLVFSGYIGYRETV